MPAKRTTPQRSSGRKPPSARRPASARSDAGLRPDAAAPGAPIDRKALLAAAREARKRAYAPYSSFPVGAAILTHDGLIYAGCNVENAAYPSTICAEQTAAVKAVSEGHPRFRALAVVTATGGAPCGQCRQILHEFGGPDLVVLIADARGRVRETTLRKLLPDGFGPESLGGASGLADEPSPPES